MNRDDMVARLISQSAYAGGDLVTLRAIDEEASELGADYYHIDELAPASRAPTWNRP